MTFHLLRDGEQVGPFTEEQVREMLAAGQATPQTLAWQAGLTEWAPLSSLMSVGSSAVVPPAVPLPPTRSSRVGVVRGCLIAFGVLAAVGVLVGAIAVGAFFYFGTGFDKSSQAYVDDAIPIIVAHWSSSELIQRLAPDYAGDFKQGDVDLLFQKLSQRLGPMQKYGSSTGDSLMNYGPGGAKVSAKYVCHASFKNGGAAITVGLIREQGKWMITGFHVESAAFL